MTKAKANGNYINSMLALQEALTDGYDEALLLDIDGFVAEGSGENIFIPKNLKPLRIVATGCGNRQVCKMDKHGFPRTSAKTVKRVHGFQTGDIVEAVVTRGKKRGTYVGRVAVRLNGYFNIRTSSGTIQGIHYKYCKITQRIDGYTYFH